MLISARDSAHNFSYEMQPVGSANFCHFPITSSNVRKDTRLSQLFCTASYGKLGGAWVLAMRLQSSVHDNIFSGVTWQKFSPWFFFPTNSQKFPAIRYVMHAQLCDVHAGVDFYVTPIYFMLNMCSMCKHGTFTLSQTLNQLKLEASSGLAMWMTWMTLCNYNPVNSYCLWTTLK